VSIELGEKLKEGRPGLILIPLLIMHLTLLSIQIEDSSGMTLFRRWSLGVAGPVLNASASGVRGVLHLWKSYFWLHGARRENEMLRASVDQLLLRDAARIQLETENERLRSLLSLKETAPVETLGARIVARAPAPDYLGSILVIDRGADDGVQANVPVLVQGGVVGRTVLVTRHNAQVQVITNPEAAVGAMVERTRSPGVLTGSGEPLLRLNYVSNTEAIEVNDRVITSGLDGIFPKGLALGKVVLSQKGNSVFRQVVVEPAADLLRVEEVLVVINRSPVKL
jgi:rod shape-determining protein MreC